MGVARIRKRLRHPLELAKWLWFQYAQGGSDIYFVSLQQSGTHWVQMMLVQALIKHYQLDYQVSTVKMKEMKELVLDLWDAPTSAMRKRKKEKSMPIIQRSHSPYFPLFRGRRVILLIRDLRDAIASHYEKHKRTHNTEISFSEFLQSPPVHQGDGYITLRWRVEFLNSWYKNRNAPKKMLLLRYEDLVADPEGELKRILDFMGMSSLGENDWQKIIEASSLETMAALERKNNEGITEKHTINRGGVGRYKDYFSQSDMEYFQEYITNYLMYDFGYAYETNSSR